MKNDDKEYYMSRGVEPYDLIESFNLNFARGNIIKYVVRAGRKTDNALDDLIKAKYYLDKEIKKVHRANQEKYNTCPVDIYRKFHDEETECKQRENSKRKEPLPGKN